MESQLLSLAELYDPTNVSAILIKFVVGYAVSQGVSQSEADAWADDIRALGSSGGYFFIYPYGRQAVFSGEE